MWLRAWTTAIHHRPAAGRVARVFVRVAAGTKLPPVPSRNSALDTGTTSANVCLRCVSRSEPAAESDPGAI
jgi:hypothetical protein